MPTTEVTTRVDEHGHEIDRTERRLYTIEELREGGGEIGSRAFENALETLGQYVLDDPEWWTESVLDNDAVELFKACGITVPPKTETINVKVDGKFQWDEQHRPVTKTITRDDRIWDSWDVDRGEFVLNPRAVVDERAFLRALQWYLSGKDIRDLPALQWGQPSPPRPIAAGRYQQRKFDLRSKDARIIREQGLVVHRASSWAAQTREFDLDYQYEGLSEQTKEDCNELLSDLCHEVVSLLRDEMDYQTSEENLIEFAQANEYTWTKDGRRA